MKRLHMDWLGEYYDWRDEGEDSLDLMMGGCHANSAITNNYERLMREDKMLGKRLLIVDDEQHIRNTYRKMFSRRGFDVRTAATAVEANDVLRKERIDILFLDIRMPEVEGDVFVDVVRCFHKGTKIVVSSVYSRDEQRERIKDADAYFDKSDGLEMLLALVATLVGEVDIFPS